MASTLGYTRTRNCRASGNTAIDGVAVDVDETGALQVRTSDGQTRSPCRRNLHPQCGWEIYIIVSITSIIEYLSPSVNRFNLENGKSKVREQFRQMNILVAIDCREELHLGLDMLLTRSWTADTTIRIVTVTEGMESLSDMLGVKDPSNFYIAEQTRLDRTRNRIAQITEQIRSSLPKAIFEERVLSGHVKEESSIMLKRGRRIWSSWDRIMRNSSNLVHSAASRKLFSSMHHARCTSHVRRSTIAARDKYSTSWCRWITLRIPMQLSIGCCGRISNSHAAFDYLQYCRHSDKISRTRKIRKSPIRC